MVRTDGSKPRSAYHRTVAGAFPKRLATSDASKKSIRPPFFGGCDKSQIPNLSALEAHCQYITENVYFF
jgi:hypothetical protein